MIKTRIFTFLATSAALILFSTSVSLGALVVYDFDTEDDLTTPLLHGQIVDPAFDVGAPENGNVFNISSTQDGSDGHLGVTVFDSDLTGTLDPDLEVGTGNILILQNDSHGGKTGDFYDNPNDEADLSDNGSIVFDFLETVAPLSIDIVDANGGFGAILTLTDFLGRTRTYTIPEKWSNEVPTLNGYDTLLLTTLAPQDGEGAGGSATAVEDAGFNEIAVVQLKMSFVGRVGVGGGSGGTTSGGIDTLVLDGVDGQNVPEPASATLMIASLAGALLRRRR